MYDSKGSFAELTFYPKVSNFGFTFVDLINQNGCSRKFTSMKEGMRYTSYEGFNLNSLLQKRPVKMNYGDLIKRQLLIDLAISHFISHHQVPWKTLCSLSTVDQ